jgi:hypothetical protein
VANFAVVPHTSGATPICDEDTCIRKHET